MGISLILGGSEPLPGWFGALMQWKLKLKWAFACVKEGVKACQDALCTYVPSKRWFGKFAQIGPEKKCPRVPVWVRGGGVNAIWAMPKWRWWQAERGFPKGSLQIKSVEKFGLLSQLRGGVCQSQILIQFFQGCFCCNMAGVPQSQPTKSPKIT